MEVTEFRGKHWFLSNFSQADVVLIDGVLDEMIYPTTEHAYQAAKTLDPNVREVIAGMAEPGAAKREGKRLRLRPDWDQVKLGYMKYLLEQKFGLQPNPVDEPGLPERRGRMLLETGEAELIEGNTWGDTYWGCVRGPDGCWIGSNHLGQLLMTIRSQLRQRASGPWRYPF